MARWRLIVAAILVMLGAIQTSAYILQFPYYRVTGSRSRSLAVPADYYQALIWLRDHTPPRSIVAEAGGLTIRGELPTTWIAERRAWLPTPYTEAIRTTPADSAFLQRPARWSAFIRDPENAALARSIGSEADYLLVPRSIESPFWTPVQRSGSWMIYRSTIPPGARE